MDMDIRCLPDFDPGIELNFTLERCFGGPPEIPGSVAGICESLARKYSIPPEDLAALAAPIQAMEEELLAVLEGRKELLSAFYQPNSPNDHRLIWAFFHLLHQPPLPEADLPVGRLIALTLNCEPGLPAEVTDFDSLMRFLAAYPCSQQTKWICTQLWRQPRRYLEQYQELLALCAPVIRAHCAPLREDYCATAEQVRQDLSSDAPEYLRQLGMSRISAEQLALCPSAAFFNGIGMVWDHTLPDSPVYFIPGIRHHRLAQLVGRYSDNTEYLSERLKAIADKRRLDILKLLKSESLCGQDLAERMGLSPATISHHMNSLVTAGFINMDKQGTRASYSINRSYMDSFLQNLGNTLL